MTFNTPFNGFFEIIDYIITFLFLIEIIYKIYYYKKDYFKDWVNILDMLLVFAASTSLLFIFKDEQPYDFSYILLLRFFKLVKFIRLGKFIPNFKKLFKDFGRAIKASASLMLGAFVMMIIISTILTYIFKDSYPTLFGNPFESAYNVFRMLTIEGWYEIPDFMAEGIPYGSSVLIRLFFSLFVFIGGMLGMSFFTSLIVDELASDNNDELKIQIKQLEEKIDELYKLNKEMIDKLKS